MVVCLKCTYSSYRSLFRITWPSYGITSCPLFLLTASVKFVLVFPFAFWSFATCLITCSLLLRSGDSPHPCDGRLCPRPPASCPIWLPQTGWYTADSIHVQPSSKKDTADRWAPPVFCQGVWVVPTCLSQNIKYFLRRKACRYQYESIFSETLAKRMPPVYAARHVASVWPVACCARVSPKSSFTYSNIVQHHAAMLHDVLHPFVQGLMRKSARPYHDMQ